MLFIYSHHVYLFAHLIFTELAVHFGDRSVVHVANWLITFRGTPHGVCVEYFPNIAWEFLSSIHLGISMMISTVLVIAARR